jgi:AraC family transcriptional regulator, regulatory protein of adaptative response / DNA-3-methyladenine glycosylase II
MDSTDLPTLAPSGFAAVHTTGIYCRPGCSASPNPSNVEPIAYAAAAEARGYRPCLRCRPDTGPGPAAWIGPSELVCRALQLIALGALDEGTEKDLARSLAVSERHLRRLFDAHVGATCEVVARSRRVHFVRRLLIETDLPIGQIAFSSGFGSIRQMNRTVKEVFRLTPSELRSRRRRSDLLVPDAGIELRLPYRPPLDWQALLSFLAPRAIPGVERVDADSYARSVHWDGTSGVVELRNSKSGSDLLMRVFLPRMDGLIHVVDRVRAMLDLDADPEVIADDLRRDPVLRPMVEARPGLRVPGSWDGFELGVRAILGQQVSVKAASTLAGRIVELAGSKINGFEHLGVSHLFPDPRVVAGSDLSFVGLTRSRFETIKRFAAEIADDSLVLDPSRGLEPMVARLSGIRGIGEWTAQYIAMRACGQPDAFPASDLGLRRAMGNGVPVPVGELVEQAQAWRPWRSYAAMHLWLSEPSASPRTTHRELSAAKAG